MNQIREDLCKFSPSELGVLLASFGIFLPFQYTCVVLALHCLWEVFNLKGYVRKQVGSKWLYLFVLYSLIISVLSKNLNGIGTAFLVLGVGLYIAIFRRHMTPLLYKYITGFIIGISITIAIIGWLEYLDICERVGIDWFKFEVLERPQDRIKSIYYNANLYATMCEYFILLCIYRYICTVNIKHRIYYVGVAVLNMGMLYLTGCRTALVPFLIVMPLFFVIAKKKTLFTITVLSEICVLIVVLLFPQIIPRFDNLSTLSSRQSIWEGAIYLISLSPLFGHGAQTYGLLYEKYTLHKAPHCHNLFLDALCSYGIVGSCLICNYIKSIIDECRSIYGEDRRSALYSLIVCTGVTTLIHGLMDCTIWFPNTLLLFMILINSGCMISNRKDFQ